MNLFALLACLVSLSISSSADHQEEQLEVVQPIAPLSFDNDPNAPLLNWKTVKLTDFWFEAGCIAVLSTYLSFFLVGSKKNKQVARVWLESHLPVWKENFFVVGDENGKALVKDGPRDYIMYGSGRIHCRNAYAMIHLAPRQDAMQSFSDYVLGNKSGDKVTVTVALNDGESDGICFAILPRKKASAFVKERWDLDNFPKPKDYPGFPKQDYLLLTDSIEFSNAIWALPNFKSAIWGSLGLEEDGSLF